MTKVRHSEALVKPVLLHSHQRVQPPKQDQLYHKKFPSLIPQNAVYLAVLKRAKCAIYFNRILPYMQWQSRRRGQKARFFTGIFVRIKKKMYLCTVICDKCKFGIKERNVSLIPFLYYHKYMLYAENEHDSNGGKEKNKTLKTDKTYTRTTCPRGDRPPKRVRLTIACEYGKGTAMT